jgi:hypothetical protein
MVEWLKRLIVFLETRMNVKKSNGGRTKGSPRSLRRNVISIFSKLAQMPDGQPGHTTSGVVKPLPIGDWRIDLAERRVAIFNRSREA